MADLLEVCDVTKVFTLRSGLFRAKIVAVENISFSIGPAEIFGLAGESGCGKTTTAKIILGLEEPTSGEIIWQNKNGKRISLRQLGIRERFGPGGIQAVFQNPFETFNPLRWVEEYFFETVSNYHLAKHKKEATMLVEETLQAVGLSYSEITGRYPGEFSGGQLQRISIARSLLTNPSLLIADEPVSMVDASLRTSIVNLFDKLRKERGMSIIYITHDLATAYYICDKIAIMFRGNIVEMGDAEQVLMTPIHPYTKLLIKSIPKADLTGRWEEKLKITELEEQEYLRKGCKFAGRCPYATKKCIEERPPDIKVNGKTVKCFLEFA